MPGSARRAAALTLPLAWAMAAFATAQTAVTPPDFNGVALGTTEAHWRAAFPSFACDASVDRVLSDRTCTFDARKHGATAGAVLTLSGVSVDEATAAFVGDRLVQIAVDYAPADAERLTDALAARYGAPKVRTTSVINRRGTTVPNVVARWSLGGGTVENRHFGATLERATLTMSVPDYLSVVQRRQLESVKAAPPP